MVVGAGGPGVEVGAGESRDGEEAVVGSKNELERLEGDAEKTLQDGRFVIGDYISCAIFPPLPNGSVAGPPPRSAVYGGGRGESAGGRGGPPPANGYGGPPRGGYGGFGGRRDGPGPRYESGRGGGMPSGEWRRGERVPDAMGGGYGRGRGRGRGY